MALESQTFEGGELAGVEFLAQDMEATAAFLHPGSQLFRMLDSPAFRFLIGAGQGQDEFHVIEPSQWGEGGLTCV